MTEDNSTVDVVVSVESQPLIVSVSKKCALSEVSQTINSILDELQKSEKRLPKWAKVTITGPEKTGAAGPMSMVEDPYDRIAHRLEVESAILKESKLFGIKDQKVQIFKPQKFAPAESVMAICFLSEIGVGKDALSYDELKEAFQESHIKSGTPLYMIISNIAGSGYIDKQRYDSQKEVVLMAKGENRIKELIKKALTS